MIVLRKLWLLFAQVATICLAALFVVTTLRPDLLARYPIDLADHPAGGDA